MPIVWPGSGRGGMESRTSNSAPTGETRPTPYKVVKVHIDRDVEGYRPERGQIDRDGAEVEDRIYNARDFDRTLVLDDRTKLVARKVTAFLSESCRLSTDWNFGIIATRW